MKCKFLRDYHGPETNEHRFLEGEIVSLSDSFGKDFVKRKIVIAIEEKRHEGGYMYSVPIPIGSEYAHNDEIITVDETIVFSKESEIKNVQPDIIVK